MLTNQHWVLMDNDSSVKTIYIFRNNSDLLLAINENVTRGKWEYLNETSLLIDVSGKSYLFRHGFFDKDVLAIRSNNNKDYSILVNENLFNNGINSIEKLEKLLENRYLKTLQTIPINVPVNGTKPVVKEKADWYLFGQIIFYLALIIGIVFLTTEKAKFRLHILGKSAEDLKSEGVSVSTRDIMLSGETLTIFILNSSLLVIGLIIMAKNYHLRAKK